MQRCSTMNRRTKKPAEPGPPNGNGVTKKPAYLAFAEPVRRWVLVEQANMREPVLVAILAWLRHKNTPRALRETFKSHGDLITDRIKEGLPYDDLVESLVERLRETLKQPEGRPR